MQVDHTAGLPPYQGRMNLAMTGCTWKSRNALIKIVTANGIILYCPILIPDGPVQMIAILTDKLMLFEVI